MARTTRLGILAGALLVLVAGTALATRSSHPQPQVPAAASHQADTPSSADELGHAVDQLHASGIDATSAQLEALAKDYGLGGAVRLLAWADASGNSVDELKAMRDGGQGWGQMAKDLGLNPGIGSIMGQGGEHGPENAPGQTKEKPDRAGEDADDPDEAPDESESPAD
jgi:hypothetical protein